MESSPGGIPTCCTSGSCTRNASSSPPSPPPTRRDAAPLAPSPRSTLARSSLLHHGAPASGTPPRSAPSASHGVSPAPAPAPSPAAAAATPSGLSSSAPSTATSLPAQTRSPLSSSCGASCTSSSSAPPPSPVPPRPRPSFFPAAAAAAAAAAASATTAPRPHTPTPSASAAAAATASDPAFLATSADTASIPPAHQWPPELRARAVAAAWRAYWRQFLLRLYWASRGDTFDAASPATGTSTPGAFAVTAAAAPPPSSSFATTASPAVRPRVRVPSHLATTTTASPTTNDTLSESGSSASSSRASWTSSTASLASLAEEEADASTAWVDDALAELSAPHPPPPPTNGARSASVFTPPWHAAPGAPSVHTHAHASEFPWWPGPLLAALLFPASRALVRAVAAVRSTLGTSLAVALLVSNDQWQPSARAGLIQALRARKGRLARRLAALRAHVQWKLMPQTLANSQYAGLAEALTDVVDVEPAPDLRVPEPPLDAPDLDRIRVASPLLHRNAPSPHRPSSVVSVADSLALSALVSAPASVCDSSDSRPASPAPSFAGTAVGMGGIAPSRPVSPYLYNEMAESVLGESDRFPAPEITDPVSLPPRAPASVYAAAGSPRRLSTLSTASSWTASRGSGSVLNHHSHHHHHHRRRPSLAASDVSALLDNATECGASTCGPPTTTAATPAAAPSVIADSAIGSSIAGKRLSYSYPHHRRRGSSASAYTAWSTSGAVGRTPPPSPIDEHEPAPDPTESLWRWLAGLSPAPELSAAAAAVAAGYPMIPTAAADHVHDPPPAWWTSTTRDPVLAAEALVAESTAAKIARNQIAAFNAAGFPQSMCEEDAPARPASAPAVSPAAQHRRRRRRRRVSGMWWAGDEHDDLDLDLGGGGVSDEDAGYVSADYSAVGKDEVPAPAPAPAPAASASFRWSTDAYRPPPTPTTPASAEAKVSPMHRHRTDSGFSTPSGVTSPSPRPASSAHHAHAHAHAHVHFDRDPVIRADPHAAAAAAALGDEEEVDLRSVRSDDDEEVDLDFGDADHAMDAAGSECGDGDEDYLSSSDDDEGEVKVYGPATPLPLPVAQQSVPGYRRRTTSWSTSSFRGGLDTVLEDALAVPPSSLHAVHGGSSGMMELGPHGIPGPITLDHHAPSASQQYQSPAMGAAASASANTTKATATAAAAAAVAAFFSNPQEWAAAAAAMGFTPPAAAPASEPAAAAATVEVAPPVEAETLADVMKEARTALAGARKACEAELAGTFALGLRLGKCERLAAELARDAETAEAELGKVDAWLAEFRTLIEEL
ncbi:hypothetical protein H9P43_005787 [Blastocladiella emersonii ATCC 22665]|nr:hypothetical protein H9P43_005787 [Blastocladiella emersonii ATCC 22665]